MVYISDSIKTSRRLDHETSYLECIWVEVVCNLTKLLIGFFYLPSASTSDFFTHFERSMESAADTDNDLVILGDFNI